MKDPNLLIEKISSQFIYHEVSPGKAVMKFIGKRDELEQGILLLRNYANILKNNPPQRDFLGFRRKKQLQEMEKNLRIAQTWEDYLNHFGYLIE